MSALIEMPSASAPVTWALSAFKPEKLPPLVGLSLSQLKALAVSLGQPAFRGEQLHHWLYVKCQPTWEAMTNLAKPFREQLGQQYRIGQLQLLEKQASKDGTVKYLFQLDDGQVIETVLMYFQERDTYALCLSTQVGCAMNCSFCATGKLGLKRHLTTGEIVEQYLFVQHDSAKEVRNVVFMGQGEPLHNYNNTLSAIRILNESAEVGIRRITVSTSGLVPEINQLSEEGLALTLAVSLHAPDDATRERIMPINKRYPLAQLMPSLHRYVGKTNRRLTIEYILIRDLNDTAEHAHRLGVLLKGLKCNVNLIPYNPISTELPNQPEFQRSRRADIERFADIVSDYGKKVTVRLERGADIDAACGQLANRFQTA